MVTPNTYAHYKCNDDAANTVVTDDGSGANNGVSSTNTANLSIVGKINDAFDFVEASSEYIGIDALSTDIASDATGSIAMWLKPNAASGTHQMFSIADTSERSALFCFLDGVDLSIYIFKNATNSAKWIQPGVITTNWQHVVFVQDGVSLKVYYNGVDITEATPTLEGDAAVSVWLSYGTNIDNGTIGVRNYRGLGNQEYFDGGLDDIRYYKAVLTQQDVHNLYRGGVGTEDDPPDFFSTGFPHSQGFIIS
ncbi:hypothetical protein LCGC14_1446860 [marine sediment metagenome]|uniref:LamG-like jellyroll fold domain-containing protein n=1 Tax=marine sediment metagenome TaxID=412755 RepID=A0A0F9JJR4_9ZZZZ